MTRHHGDSPRRDVSKRRAIVEAMEPRTLFATAPPFDPATDGFTPAQIRKAYGFDQASFANGTVPADGRGQTIAIVDAFDNPTIAMDLSTFDTQFGIPAPPSFQIVNQRGQSGSGALPPSNTDWAGEITLDVEWSHAIAPMANILLVETDDNSPDNLLAGVDLARKMPGVSVVSMSFGGSEFFQFNAGSVTSELQSDPIYTTPVGHQGVTFVASAGDSGAQVGVQHPSGSPNVLSVGGTSLTLKDPSGTYGSEAYWVGTNSGYSQLEVEPSFQRQVQGVGFRSSPDVTYDADPATGFAVFSTFAFGGWFSAPGDNGIGGTSAGSPQWAALVAIANQGRVLNGKGTLDGPNQTIPLLYSLYNPPFTPGFASYSNYFNDVTIPAASPTIQWRWGGVGFNDAIPVQGFDTATGLGSPKAAAVIQALSTLDAPVRLPITGSFDTALPASVVGSDAGKVKLTLSNNADVPFDGPITITLYASTDTVLSADDTRFFSVLIPGVSLKPHKSKNFHLKFDYPGSLTTGSYHLIAAVDAPNSNSSESAIIASAPVTIAAPSADLAASFVGNPVLVRPGQNATAVLRIENVGNQVATGNVSLILYASTDQVLNPAVDEGLVGLPARRVDLKPGKSMIIRIPFVAPIDKAGGSYFLIASITPNVQPADPNAANNVAVIATRATGRAARALERMRVKWHLL